MGQASSRVFNALTKEIRNFNVENRAHRVISRDKPKPAPRYPADEKELERLAAEHPEYLEEQSKKLSDLDKRLKKVFVISHDPEHTAKQEPSSTRPLPMTRTTPARPEFGFEEPPQVAVGKVTLKQAIKFIADHQDDPVQWNIESIAKHYKLKTDDVENILVHFRPFLLLVPEEPKGGKKNLRLMATPQRQKLSP